MRAVDIEDVETGIDGPAGGFGIHPDDAQEVALFRLAGIGLRYPRRRELVRGRTYVAGAQTVREPAGVTKLHPGERSPSVDAVGHVAMIDDVALIVEARHIGDRLMQASVHRAAQPPSAFTSRCIALAPGLLFPAPVH